MDYILSYINVHKDQEFQEFTSSHIHTSNQNSLHKQPQIKTADTPRLSQAEAAMSIDVSHRICKHCNKKATDPVLSACCRENFCKKCIEEINRSKRPCPKCGSRDPGCLEKQASIYDVDLDVSCDAGCGWVGENEDIDAHREVCEFVEIKCDFCEKDMRRKDKKVHYDRDCPEKVVQCPKKCGLCFKRKDLDNHIRECGKTSLMMAELKAKIEQHQETIDQLTEQLQAQQKANDVKHVTTTDALKTSQEQQQQKFDQLQQQLQAQQEKCDKKHQEHSQKLMTANKKVILVQQREGWSMCCWICILVVVFAMILTLVI